MCYVAGIGSCFAAAIYEVGRPTRLSSDEAVELESQWQDFGEPTNVAVSSVALFWLSDDRETYPPSVAISGVVLA